ncbi:hypothetical protein BJX76DRAFT_346062 [Aspergillus varians]
MPALYTFVERIADMLISAAGSKRSRPSSPPPAYSTGPLPSFHSSHPHRNDENNPLGSFPRPCRDPTSIPLAKSQTRDVPPRSNPNYNSGHGKQSADSNRYVRSAQRARNVHWGTITEIPSGSTQPTTPGLNEYPHRKSNTRTSTSSRSRSNSPVDRANSPSPTGSDSSYKEQRYPPAWYSCSFSPSSQPVPTTGAGARTERERQRPLHRTHMPRKTILKAPTPTDDEMLIRNLWEMVVLSDQRLDYMYEFLSGVLLVGDDILDTMFRAGELSMFEEAARHANRMGKRQRAREFRPTKVPVPRQNGARGRQLPAHARSEGRVRRGPAGPVFRGPSEMNSIVEVEER